MLLLAADLVDSSNFFLLGKPFVEKKSLKGWISSGEKKIGSEGSSNSIAAPSPHSHYRRHRSHRRHRSRPQLPTHAPPPSTASAHAKPPPRRRCSPHRRTQLSHHLAAGRNCRTTSPPVALPRYSPGVSEVPGGTNNNNYANVQLIVEPRVMYLKICETKNIQTAKQVYFT
ncbi:uncharacterized protein LOC116005670 [Ipomoea triloba]|uniref:uncharacterized protein LOC116005670 n=1 Tax=Ipomoea triloba TaxID=35885 RepID=UPI00125DF278|nr:uncharacterized protein LOC116005670 [Ipomoea triloba]